MNIQEAIRSGKPFRRAGWMNDDVFVVYQAHDIVLTFESDPHTAIELDVQDLLADDWFTRDDLCDRHGIPDQMFQRPIQVEGREPSE